MRKNAEKCSFGEIVREARENFLRSSPPPPLPSVPAFSNGERDPSILPEADIKHWHTTKAPPPRQSQMSLDIQYLKDPYQENRFSKTQTQMLLFV